MHSLDREPWLFPWKVSREEEHVEFLDMTRELFESVTFHDVVQLAGRAPTAGRLSFRDVIVFHREIQNTLPAPRYIFHHAFCCSTLLARSLGPPGIVFGYREPAALTEIALIDLRDRAFVRSDSGYALLAALADLHCRTENGSGELPVIKACDAVNGIIEPLMSVRPDARAVLVFSDLEPFVLACLVSDDRRTWTRGRVPAFQHWPLPCFIRDAPIAALSDGQVAACLWVLHMHLFADLIARMPEQFFPLDCEELLRDPAGAASAVARFLHLRTESAEEQANGMRQVHAKTGMPYNAQTRRADLAALQRERFEDLDAARRWCGEAGLPIVGREFLDK